MQEIQDIFSDSKKRNQKFSLYPYDDGLKIIFASKGSIRDNISSLAEVFTEWYLFDSSYEKDIQKFLSTEQIDDVFTESEFIDLMCNKAYVDNDLIQFISMKLPFRITLERLHLLNKSVKDENDSTYKIISKPFLTNKLREVFQSKHHTTKSHRASHRNTDPEHTRIVKHEYYLRNKEYIKNIKREYYLKNREHIKQQSKEYYATNKDRIKAYFAANKEHIQKIKHKSYIKNREYYQKRNEKYYAANRDKQRQYSKEYYIAHCEEQKQYLKKYYEQSKKNKALAKTMCAAYLFLLKFKKENTDEYLKLYKKYHDPLHNMFKTCTALQNENINQCPFYIENFDKNPEQYCDKKILSIPNAITEIQSIATNLKQK